MLINHPHHFITDTESPVEPNTLDERDCRHVNSLAVLVSAMRRWSNERETKRDLKSRNITY